MELKEYKTKKWNGIYKGVDFEICNWQTPPNNIDPNEKNYWNYYLYLHLDRIPTENKPNSYWLKGRKYRNHVYYDYYQFYSKEYWFDKDWFKKAWEKTAIP